MLFPRVALLGLALLVGLASCAKPDQDDGIATANGLAPSASASTDSDVSLRDQMLRYSQCMRDNGVPEFPDPEFSGDGAGSGGVGITVPDGVSREKLDAANEKCRQYMPNGGERQPMDAEELEKLRQFAQCMREHGFPDFPDPTDEGMAIDGSQHPDWTPSNPEWKAANDACAQYRPGPDGGERTESREDA